MVEMRGALAVRTSSAHFLLALGISGCGALGGDSQEGVSVTGLAAEDSSMCVPPPAGVVAWWPGDGNANDIAGDHDGTIEGGVTFEPEDGKVGQAFNFDGARGTLVRSSATGFPAGRGPRTVEFWTKLKPDTDVNTENMPAFGYGTAAAGQVFYTFPEIDKYDGKLAFSGGGISYDIVTMRDLRDGQWHHLAVTYDGNAVTIFSDGDVAGTGNLQLNTAAAGGACIGGSCIGNSALQSLTGQVDEITLYNRALSRAEIQTIVAAGGAGKCKRKKTVVLVQGINTSLEFTNVPSDGDVACGASCARRCKGSTNFSTILNGLQGSGAEIVYYSYTGGSISSDGRWCASPYDKASTSRGLGGSISGLNAMIRQISTATPSNDVFVIGHSQGGLIAFQALGMLSSVTNDGRLRMVATLDAPLGGAPLSHTIVPDLGTPWGAPASLNMNRIYNTGPKNHLQGTLATTACSLFGGCPGFAGRRVSNLEAVLETANIPEDRRPVVINIGADRDDAVYRPGACNIQLPFVVADNSATQWVDHIGTDSHLVRAVPMGGANPVPTWPFLLSGCLSGNAPTCAQYYRCLLSSHDAVIGRFGDLLAGCVAGRPCR